jgi:hypothetical protein
MNLEYCTLEHIHYQRKITERQWENFGKMNHWFWILLNIIVGSTMFFTSSGLPVNLMIALTLTLLTETVRKSNVEKYKESC